MPGLAGSRFDGPLRNRARHESDPCDDEPDTLAAPFLRPAARKATIDRRDDFLQVTQIATGSRVAHLGDPEGPSFEPRSAPPRVASRTLGPDELR
jgi:hypothetical protein